MWCTAFKLLNAVSFLSRILWLSAWMWTFNLASENGVNSAPGLKEERFPNFSIITPDRYDVQSPPESKEGPAVIKIQMEPWKIGDISVEQMTFEVDMFLIISWRDHRLRFEGVDNVPSWKRVTISEKEASTIWLPTVNFRNVMGSKGMSFEPDFLNMRLRAGELLFLIRKVDRFHCHFDLSLYPMDTQSCAVEVQALTFKSSVVLKDVTKVYEFRGGSDPPRFVVYRHASGPCTRKDGSDKYYSCLEYRFYFRRLIGHHIMMTYIPSSLIVCLTWVSFWLDVDATPARVGLGLTSLLTLATQFSSTQKNLPPVAYIKAIDIWMFSCIFMVFGSIVEFAIANYTARCTRTVVVVPIKQVNTQSSNTKAHRLKDQAKTVLSRTSVDEFARVIFPLTFLVFVIAYWSYFGSHDEL